MTDGNSRPVDMSPEAIDQRLRDVSDLLELCLSLRKARILGPWREEQSDGDAPTATVPNARRSKV